MGSRLKGKVAIISGAGSVGPGWGNGRATTVRFVEEGAQVFAVDRDQAPLAETVQKAPGIATHLCDVTDSAAVKAMIDACLKRFGRVPKRGEQVIMEGFTFKVVRADSRRLHLLEVIPRSTVNA